MLYDLLNILPQLIGIAMPIGGMIYTWFATRSQQYADAMAKLEKRLDELERHTLSTEALERLITRVEVAERDLARHELTLENLPTKDAMHQLQLSMQKIESTVMVMGETMKGVKETSNLLRDWLVRKETP